MVARLSSRVPIVESDGSASAFMQRSFADVVSRLAPQLIASGQLAFVPVSDTQIEVRYKGSDGVTRTTMWTFT